MSDKSIPWTTILDRDYNTEGIRLAVFEPPQWDKICKPVILLQIPECIEMCMAGYPAPICVEIIRTTNIKKAVQLSCKSAKLIGAILHFACDTDDQIEIAVRLVERWLPDFRRLPLERIGCHYGDLM